MVLLSEWRTSVVDNSSEIGPDQIKHVYERLLVDGGLNREELTMMLRSDSYFGTNLTVTSSELQPTINTLQSLEEFIHVTFADSSLTLLLTQLKQVLERVSAALKLEEDYAQFTSQLHRSVHIFSDAELKHLYLMATNTKVGFRAFKLILIDRYKFKNLHSIRPRLFMLVSECFLGVSPEGRYDKIRRLMQPAPFKVISVTPQELELEPNGTLAKRASEGTLILEIPSESDGDGPTG